MSRPPDLLVICPLRDWTCQLCGGTGALLRMERPGPVCLSCADLDHLTFLPSGNAALTRRAKTGSALSAVVVRFSRSRKRYERRGLLVEEAALAQAEAQCLTAAEARSRRRQRDAARRAVGDDLLRARIAAQIARLFPGCTPERRQAIVRQATIRASGGHGGPTAAACDLGPPDLERAVAASVRHHDTRYDKLLMAGMDRVQARDQVQPDVTGVLDRWRRQPALA